jgi:hypothetical protein
MTAAVKLKNGVTVKELRPGRAVVNFRFPFGASYVAPEPSAEVLAAMASFSSRGANRRESLQPGTADSINPGLTFNDVAPQETDYIFPRHRALSAVLIPGYFIDFSRGTVLKDSMPLLAEQTIYCDHVYWRTREWVGAVNQVTWDTKLDIAGAPGINTENKVDWRKAPDVARGLLMKPPAVKAVSCTVDFEWDASHPDLLEKRIFWMSLGEEVDGQIVRLIVTKIRDYYELSYVYKGANPGSNGLLPDEDGEDEEFSAGGKPAQLSRGKTGLSLIEKETKKVKLTAEQKKRLGLEAHSGDEVADAIVLAAVDSSITALETRANAATPIVDAARAEVLRLATLAEADKDGKLDATLSDIISKADPSQLPGLTTMYATKAEAKFAKTCQDCGSKNIGNRSSVEAPQTAQQSAPIASTNLL